MDAATLEDDVRDDLETELSRLGSSKWLYALTGGDLDGDSVRAAAATDANQAALTFDSWADDEDDADAAALFADAAETTRGHVSAVEADPTGAERQLYDALADVEGTVERLGALLGWSLVAGKTAGQLVGFFVGDAKPAAADTFRDVRDGVDDLRDRTCGALDAACEDEESWERAAAAATDVVEAAYDEYVKKLEAMGIKPKNVC